MKTLDDMEQELKRLRSRVRQLEGTVTPSQDTVLAIVESDPYDDKLISGGGGGGFSKACAASHADQVEQQKKAARRELQDNPGRVRTPMALHGFRATYAAVPSDDLDDMIRELAR